MDYEKKRGTQYYTENEPDPNDADLVIEVTKKRRVVALQWKGPDGQIYRAPDTEAGADSLDRRRWRLLGFTPEQIAEEQEEA